MPLRRLSAIALTIALMLSGVLTACGGDDGDGGAESDSGADLTTVKVGTLPYSGMAPIHLGIKHGFFEDEGLKLELTPGEAPAPIVSQVLSGQLDIGFTTTIALITAVSEGAPVKAVAPVEGVVDPDNPAAAILVLPDSSIRSPADLEGKKVAVPALKSELDLFTKVVVDDDGGDSSEVQSVQIPFPEMYPALKAGRVDAIATTEPFVTLATQDGARSIAYPEIEVLPNGTITTWASSEQFISQNPDVIEAFDAGMKRSLEYGADHPAEARKIIGTFTELEPDVLKEISLGVIYEPELSLDSLEKTIGLMDDYGLVEQPPTVDDIVANPSP